LTFTRGWLLAT